MPDAVLKTLLPPDQRQRERALDPGRCVLVRAPAGSGKTDLLTRRFLRLLAEVDDPGEIVAITFTKAAAAEMRNRILAELEKAEARKADEIDSDPFSMGALAARALACSRARKWNLIDLPAQLRISTIDSFCRELALQRPLLSGLGGAPEIDDHPHELYRRAARLTLQAIEEKDADLREAIRSLLLWRDNGWQEIEDQLVEMLEKRDRWMREFVVGSDPDWDDVRQRLESPFRRAVRAALVQLNELLDRAPNAREEILALARFACAQTSGSLHRELAELAEFPCPPFDEVETLDEAQQACACVANLLLKKDGGFFSKVDKRHGFPADRKAELNRLKNLIGDLSRIPGLEAALAAIRELPPPRYTEDEWRIVRACFLLLRRAAAELQVVFAETGTADYVEVAQIAESVLAGENAIPGESALAVADGIRHLLVDEFQDTSRRQHHLLARLIAAWPGRERRTCFVVGDPMQSIYFFRDADAELFPRVENLGLEIPGDLPLVFDPVALTANFRTAPALVTELNDAFTQVFAQDDGSGIRFTATEPAREKNPPSGLHAARVPARRMELHLAFIPATPNARSGDSGAAAEKERALAERIEAHQRQTDEIVALIRAQQPYIEQARAAGAKYRIAVLGRTRKALAPVAAALRAEKIPIRAVDLEPLKDRPEVLDALALGRALMNPEDRVAWLGVLRAPWCGLSLEDLHTLVSADAADLLARPVPELLHERLQLLSAEGRVAVERVSHAIDAAAHLRSAQPSAALGTWLRQVWLALGGALCVDAAGRANLDLLWRSLDALSDGEQDLLGSALDSALENLTARPDPEADENCGVQLMTIHKAKGLEFEVVIVPELQAVTRHTATKLLSWLERGLAEPDDSGQPTEFLVAPIAAKGADRGNAKAWVDRVSREREHQEMRRLLYVAATRAREHLHLFARPPYKTEKNLSRSLIEASGSLLTTAWPALEEQIRNCFVEWRQETSQRELEGGVRKEMDLDAIAASSDDDIGEVALLKKGTMLRRLPPDVLEPMTRAARPFAETAIAGLGPLYQRHEGGLHARALGIAVHALLEEMARLRASEEWDAVRAALPRLAPRIAAQIRSAGIDQSESARMAAHAIEIALKATDDPIGAWILSPRIDAESEARWAGIASGKLRAVQVDRVFRAGTDPRSAGDGVWWIVDYKTAIDNQTVHGEGANPEAALPELRKVFAPQLEAYAQVLRNLHGAHAPVRAGLYYPRMLEFDWWEIG
jgi:ATP-dependent helicase/nuclease subunit A